MDFSSQLDYVEFYANMLKADCTHFEQQKMLIDSQLQASSSLFKRMFAGDFKAKARNYLRGVGMLK